MKALHLILILVGWSLAPPSPAEGLKWPEQRVPPAALKYLPVLKQQTELQFPEWPYGWYVAAQVEQETCYSATHSKCFNPYAKLKTSREYGFGIGQTTIAYDKFGKERFNNFNEAKKLPGVSTWQWENRYDFNMQLTVLLQSMKINWYKTQNLAEDETSHIAMALNTYNGGYGGLQQDRELCRRTAGCNPNVWYDNVERYSTKTKVVNPGYGGSAFTISREYPHNIMHRRSDKYKIFWN